MSWILHITVAAIIEQQGKYLLVKEMVNNHLTYNQPAGHLEENESLPEAVIREVYEETGMNFEPRNIVGIYHWQEKHRRDTYIRVAFTGSVKDTHPVTIPDKKIIGTEWLNKDEIMALPTEQLRTNMVLKCIEDYLDDKIYPLDILHYMSRCNHCQ